MEWEHNVSREWLKERRKYLTASDVVALLPAYKRMLKAIESHDKKELAKQKKDKEYTPVLWKNIYNTDVALSDRLDLLRDFAAYYINKSSDESLITASPSSAAARGHILEPYAVEEYNNIRTDDDPLPMHHWDDKIIYSNILTPTQQSGVYMQLAFSPDALSTSDHYGDKTVINQAEINNEFNNSPRAMMEIKSYNTKKHGEKILSKSRECDERYQIATAMLVDPCIIDAVLFFYCPQCVTPIDWKYYERNGLKEEMNLVLDLWRVYNLSIEIYNKVHPYDESMYSEKDIHAAYMREKTKSLLTGEAH